MNAIAVAHIDFLDETTSGGIHVLNDFEIDAVSGGDTNPTEAGIGLGLIGIGLGIAAVSGIGIVGIGVATYSAWMGGVLFGDGMFGGGSIFGMYF